MHRVKQTVKRMVGKGQKLDEIEFEKTLYAEISEIAGDPDKLERVKRNARRKAREAGLAVGESGVSSDEDGSDGGKGRT